MEYKSDKPIYLQIADFICSQIMQNHWQENERILSVRELSSQLGVNPNTVVRAFENVENSGIIYNKRGIGFFVSEAAKSKIAEIYKKEFFAEFLPSLFKKMQLLNISISEIEQAFLEYLSIK
jgi:DNA-binding transcriptional regulator YhcF (GntR family)